MPRGCAGCRGLIPQTHVVDAQAAILVLAAECGKKIGEFDLRRLVGAAWRLGSRGEVGGVGAGPVHVEADHVGAEQQAEDGLPAKLVDIEVGGGADLVVLEKFPAVRPTLGRERAVDGSGQPNMSR